MQEIKLLSEFHKEKNIGANPKMPDTWDEWMDWFEQRFKEDREEPREIDFGYITPEMAEQLNKLLKEEFDERINTTNKRSKLSTRKKSKP